MSESTQILPFGIQRQLTSDELWDLEHKRINNLRDSYSDPVDLYTELIQNAFDAVQLADQPGIIKIELNTNKTNPYFIISDNGIGMNAEQLSKISINGHSHKNATSSIGHKGVGTVYAISCTNHWSISTRTKQCSAANSEALLNTHSWVDNPQTSKPSFAKHSIPNTNQIWSFGITEQGTTIYVSLDHKPDTVLYQAGNAEDWLTFFAATTAIGHSKVFNHPIQINLVHRSGSSETTITSTNAGKSSQFHPSLNQISFPLPGPLPPLRCLNINKQPEKGSKLINWKRRNKQNQDIIYQTFENDALQVLIQEIPNFPISLADSILFIHASLAATAGTFQGEIPLGEFKRRILPYGIRIAPQGVPQGRPLSFRLTKNTGLNRASHVYIVTSELPMDVGRKVLKEASHIEFLEKLGTKAINYLIPIRGEFLKKKPNNSAPSSTDWIESTNNKEINSWQELIKILGTPVPQPIEPDEEQDLIVLFQALLASNTIEDISILAASSIRQYDSVLYNKKTKEKLICEFKLDFEDVLADMNNDIKHATEMDLVVCWRCVAEDDTKHVSGTILPCFGPYSQSKKLPAQTHTWIDLNTQEEINIISLETLIIETAHKLVKNKSNGISQEVRNLWEKLIISNDSD